MKILPKRARANQYPETVKPDRLVTDISGAVRGNRKQNI